MGALTAAFELTAHPHLRERYDITVYQQGWRLGGKGASGRNHRYHERIEEHGLHLWMGFYENAFNVMRRCYAELGRPAGAPLATWQDAFKPLHSGGVGELLGRRWSLWLSDFQSNRRLPGEGEELFSLAHNLVELGEMILLGATILLGPPGLIQRTVMELGSTVSRLARDAAARLASMTGAGELYRAFLDWQRLLSETPGRLRDAAGALGGLMDSLWARVEPVFSAQDSVRHLFIIVDIFATCFRGAIADGILFEGFDVIEHRDLREWLRSHGARPVSYNSPLVRGTYDLVFATGPGATLSAGTALRFMSRMVLDYRGAIFWKMQAGMGDVVFAPMYEVMARRGVRFEFFHTVRKLRLAPEDPTLIDEIVLDRQVRLVPGLDAYQPLRDVQGLPCWPSEPLYEQLERGAELEAGWSGKNYNLESWWSAWQPAEQLTLRRGRDFDLVVLGIPLGVLPFICEELIAHAPAWKQMVEKIPTVPTLALQLWFRPELHELGWRGPRGVVDAGPDPFSTWADMSHLLQREDWRGSSEPPRTLAYLCGRAPEGELPGPEAHGFPAEQVARIKQEAVTWLERNARLFWPAATRADNPAGLDYKVLVDAEAREGEARLDAHYVRVNNDPSERYVLSPMATARYRLRPGQSGFRNLYLAGDWTKTGLDLGCIESAVMSGMIASRAISGSPERVIGEQDPTLPKLRLR